MDYAIYDSNGRIFATGIAQVNIPVEFAAEKAAEANGAAGYLIGTVDMATMYAVAGVAVPMPENPARLQDGNLVDLPIPCLIRINGEPYYCEDGTAELEFGDSGPFTVIVTAWPYLDKEFLIEDPSP